MYEDFKITPSEFFDPAFSNPSLLQTVINDIKTFSENDLLLLSLVLKRFVSKPDNHISFPNYE